MPKFEISDVDTSYSEAPEDIEGQISAVESTFKQRANSLEAGVNRLTEGLRTKADISSLNVTAENIRQSVKSLETDTQNKLNQKLSQAEFEVRAGSIRQEILNATKDKANKSELTQTAEELSSKIASVQVGGINLLRNTASLLIGDRSKGCWMSASGGNGRAISVEVLDSPKKMIKNMIRVIENTNGGNKDLTQLVRLRIGEKYTISCYARIASDSPNANVNLLFRSWANNTDLNRKFQKSISHKNWQKYSFTFTADAIENSIQFGQSGAGIIEICAPKIESGTLATDYSEAPEDIEGQISTVESTFKQRANSLDAGVRSLTEGLRTKVDISSLNVTAENIRQSVKSLETDTQNKLNQKLSQAEFEVRAGSIRQEILNATKDNAERQMGRISDQVSANKANADSQFANVTNQLARKVETTDFQRVKETSKLYERILGNTENGIADKVARMALTNQLFQVEVGKYSVSGPNLIKNSDFKNATNEWGSTQNLGRLVKHSFYHNGQKDLMRLSNATKNENFLYSHRFNLERNTDYVLNFRGFNNSALASYDVYILGRRAGESDGFTIVKKVVSSKKLSTSRCEDVSVTFNSGEMDNAYIRFDNNGSSSGTADLYITEVDLYKGYKPRTWQPHPEDAVADANKKLEATQTKMTQLAGSWVVENINSAGDIISGINLGANGHNRLVGKLTHITGETLIDRAVIKSAMVDKLKTANFEAGSVTTTILEAEAVTAEKLKVDNALIKKLTATDAFIDQLISKRIFSTKVESVISSSTFLEAYQGRIGGFTLGQFDQGGGRWISGVNQFSVGMGNGAGYGVRTAFWANWGNNWNYAGPKAWNVNTDGKMYCRNEVGFYDQVDFSNSSRANFYGNTTFSRSPVFSNGIELGSKDVLGDGWNPKGGRNAVVWWNQVGSGSLKYWMEQKSDRRLKENITDTAVKALDKINRLRMVAFDFIENKKHEEIGLIAQEAETIVPRIVSRDPENPDGYLHIDYTALVPYLIKAIQELNQKIEKMEKTIA
ncbi:PblB [Streptococcus pneumoniae]|nr:PblB [Streptococcus pneumoniae]